MLYVLPSAGLEFPGEAFANIPQLGPFTIAAGQSQCSTDAKCLCSDKTFISSVTKKVEDACSKEEVDTMVKVATEACKSANVTVDIPLGAKDNSTADGESWGERSSTVNFAMMVGVLGLAAQAVL